MYQLWVLGAMDEDGNLTALGKDMVEFPLDPPLAKMVIFAHALGCSDEVITIVSMLSVPNLFYRPSGREEEADGMREKFYVSESDHLTLYNVYEQWRRNGCKAAWCAKHFLHHKSLIKAKEVREQLVEVMQLQKMTPKKSGDWDIIRKVRISCIKITHI